MNHPVQLECGDAMARLLPAAGGRITALRLARPGGAALDILHPYPEHFFDPLHWAKGGIYPLLPYSNRIGHARLTFEGRQIALQAHPDAAPHTLHGNAHALGWELAQADAHSAVMTLDCPASAAWPWHYRGRMKVQLTPHELTLHIALRNADTRSMPAGIGLHPYFRHRPEGRVAYAATTAWPPTSDFLATEARAPRPDEIHLPARALPSGGLTHYLGGWDGDARIELPEGARLRLSADPVFSHLVVHRPDTAAYLCLEPVSHVADGFNLAARGVPGTGTRIIEPGESMQGAIRLQLLGPAA